ncbi:MAG: type II secretion system F family protein [Rickettsiales bacterium]|nr:type II secretion system F family protein [Rickettsiales bacterium]
MPVFKYTVVKADTTISKGKMNAPTKDYANDILQSSGYQVLSLKREWLTLTPTTNKLSRQELITFFSSISSMDRVGVDMLRSLEMMKDDIASGGGLKNVSEKIYFFVANGDSLSTACKKASPSFTDDYIGLIAIAENTGNFAKIFDEIVDFIKYNYEVNQRTKSAVRGPLGTLVMTIGIIVAMSIIVLPKITTFLDDMGVKIPWYTLALIKFATFITNYWQIGIGVIAGVVIGIKVASIFNKTFMIAVDRLKLKIPIFGDLLLKLDVSRFISFFTLMYNSGADIINIIQSVSKTLSNKYLGYRIEQMQYKILDGLSIFQSINSEKVFPSMFRRLFSICEATGEIGAVLYNIKFFYDNETKETTEKVIGLIKPFLTIVLGGVVLWMALGMMMPIYSNMGNLGQVQA